MIEIVWPDRRVLPDFVIEQWFIDALAKGEIQPADISSRTPEAMAQALDHAGIIRLLVNNSCDTTNK